MNPLDPLELQAFARRLNDEMPIHTDTTAKIKRSFSQGMPKNLMEYSAHVDNKFLNDNLAIIEEMYHRDQIHPIPKWFREYQIMYYAKHGILNHDGFFASRLRDGFLKPDLFETRWIGSHAAMNFKNVGFTSVIGGTKVLGAELLTNTSETGTSSFASTTLYIGQFATGVAGQVYNQISVKASTTTGNVRLGVYRDLTSLTMSDLVGQTGEIAMFSDYAYKSVSEFELPAGGIIYGAIHLSNSNTITRGNGPHRYSASRSYQALPASISVTDDGTTIIQTMKIRGN